MDNDDKGPDNNAAALALKEMQLKADSKITYQMIAKETGIPANSISSMLTNRMDIRVGQFLAIAGALGVDKATALDIFKKVVLEKNL